MIVFCLMNSIRSKIAFLESSEPVKHLRNAKKEVLLAIRALIDMAICEVDKAEEKQKIVEVE